MSGWLAIMSSNGKWWSLKPELTILAPGSAVAVQCWLSGCPPGPGAWWAGPRWRRYSPCCARADCSSSTLCSHGTALLTALCSWPRRGAGAGAAAAGDDDDDDLQCRRFPCMIPMLARLVQQIVQSPPIKHSVTVLGRGRVKSSISNSVEGNGGQDTRESATRYSYPICYASGKLLQQAVVRG